MDKCLYYLILVIHDTLKNCRIVCNTLCQNLVLIRVLVAKLFRKNMASTPLKSLVGPIRVKVNFGEEEQTRNGTVFKYEDVDGLIYHSCLKSVCLD